MPIQMNSLLIVIRDFAKDYFNLIQDWGVNLIKDTINRRSLSQRNNPGQLVRVGISEGQRNARIFGWVWNLKKRYHNASDQGWTTSVWFDRNALNQGLIEKSVA